MSGRCVRCQTLALPLSSSSPTLLSLSLSLFLFEAVALCANKIVRLLPFRAFPAMWERTNGNDNVPGDGGNDPMLVKILITVA